MKPVAGGIQGRLSDKVGSAQTSLRKAGTRGRTLSLLEAARSRGLPPGRDMQLNTTTQFWESKKVYADTFLS